MILSLPIHPPALPLSTLVVQKIIRGPVFPRGAWKQAVAVVTNVDLRKPGHGAVITIGIDLVKRAEMIHSVHGNGEIVLVVAGEVAVRAVDVGLIGAKGDLRDDDGGLTGAERRRDRAGGWGIARDSSGSRRGVRQDESRCDA